MDLKLVFFFYGLAFFVLGITTWVRIKPLTDLKLARVFGWLATFGFIHAACEWIDMFTVMGHAVIFISNFNGLLKALSFAVLLRFGIEFFGLKKNLSRTIRLIPTILFLLWFSLFFRSLFSDEGAKVAEIWARYILGFPGTILSASAFISGRKQISNNPRISRNIVLAGLCFGFYAIFTVIVPKADFFPASVLNYPEFLSLVGLPIQVFRALCAVVIAFFVLLSLEVFDVEEKRTLEVQVKEKTRALSESEEKYRTIMEDAGEAILIADTEANILEVNRQAEQLLGYSKKEILKLRIQDICSGEELERTSLFFRKVVVEGKAHLTDIFILKKDGATIPVDITATVITYGKKEVVQGIFKDITERKQAAEKLQQSYDTQTVLNSLLRLSLENIPLEEFLKQALDRMLSIPWLTFEKSGGIFLVEDEPNVLVMKIQSGLSEQIQKTCARIPFGRCLCGRAAALQKVQFADCIDERHETTYKGIQPHGHYYSVKLVFNSLIDFVKFLTSFALCKMPGDFGLKAIAFCGPCQNFFG